MKDKTVCMTLEKVQKFLKNKHKFDHKPELYDVIEKIDKLQSSFREAIKTESVPNLKKSMTDLLTEFIMISNRYDIDLTMLLKDEFNLN